MEHQSGERVLGQSEGQCLPSEDIIMQLESLLQLLKQQRQPSCMLKTSVTADTMQLSVATVAKGDSLATPHPSHPNLNDVGPRLLSVNNSGCLDNAINLSMVGGACCVGGHCDCKPQVAQQQQTGGLLDVELGQQHGEGSSPKRDQALHAIQPLVGENCTSATDKGRQEKALASICKSLPGGRDSFKSADATLVQFATPGETSCKFPGSNVCASTFGSVPHMLHATLDGQANVAECGLDELTVSSSRSFAPDLRVGRPNADPRGVMHGRTIEQGTTQPRVEEFGGLEDLTHALEKVLGRPIGEAFSDSGTNSQLLNDALAQFTPQGAADDVMTDPLNETERQELERLRILHRYPVLDTLDPMRAVPPPRVGEHRIFAGALHVFGDDLRWHLETRGMPPGVQREHLAYQVHPDVNALRLEQLEQRPVLQQPVMQRPRVGVQPMAAAVPVAESGQQQQPSLVPREVKIEKPLTFSGKHSDLQNFLFVMRQYIDTVGLGTGAKACRFLVSYLRDDALTWWRSYSDNSLDIFEDLTLDILLSELEEQFSDLDKELKLRDKILGLRQLGTVQSYVTAFKKLQLELGTHRLGNEMALYCFVQGLKPYTRQQVHMQRPSTFEEACLLAERCDQSLSWVSRNRGSSGGMQQRSGGHQRPGGKHGVPFRLQSQYNTPARGPQPMVLGAMQQQRDLKKITCFHCGKTGHVKKNCYKFKAEQQKAQQSKN